MDRNKIGIFGDSFADINPTARIDEAAGRVPWPLTLGKILNKEIIPKGATATSTWYSYKNFLNYYKEVDTVVFCYSSNDRWHNINSDQPRVTIYHIISPDQLGHVPPRFKDLAKKLVDVHPHLFDPQLNLFVVQNVFNSVNDICRENNIKIVNIFNFEELYDVPLTIDISKNAGTVLTNLVSVSGNEIKHPDRKPKDTAIFNDITYNYDKRFCHINPYNNTALAHIIVDCIENDVQYKNLAYDDRFSYDIEHLRYILDYED